MIADVLIARPSAAIHKTSVAVAMTVLPSAVTQTSGCPAADAMQLKIVNNHAG